MNFGFYDEYKFSRNQAWKILIKYGINKLPIKTSSLCKSIGINLYSYSTGIKLITLYNLHNHTQGNDGFSTVINNSYVIFYNEKTSISRLRFTIAHELGHIVLGHLKTNNLACRNHVSLNNIGDIETANSLESAANIFARDLLMPATVLSAFNIRTSGEIMNLCDVSYQSAVIRAKRMEILYKRDMFNKHPLEKRVRKQFASFIANKEMKMMENTAYKNDEKYEILDGKIVLMSPRPSINHNIVSGNIYHIFRKYLKGQQCTAFTDGVDVHLSDNDIVIPDVMIVCNRDIIKPDGIYGSPNLIVEVLSPSTAKNDKGYKKDLYERCGIKEYWIVDTASKSIEVYLLCDGKYVLNEVYCILMDYTIEKMTEEEKKQIVTSFRSALNSELIINIGEVFNNLF